MNRTLARTELKQEDSSLFSPSQVAGTLASVIIVKLPTPPRGVPVVISGLSAYRKEGLSSNRKGKFTLLLEKP